VRRRTTSNQRGVQFDVLTDLVRASRPHFIWHLDKARSRVATHILAEQTPGLMQSACQDALALAVARKAKVAPLKRASAKLDTEKLPLCETYHAPGYLFDSIAKESRLRAVSSLLARLSSKLVG